MSDSQKGLIVAVPLLGGALLRLALGLLTDQIGAKRTGILGMALTTLPLLLGWLWADSFEKLVLVGLLLGVAGASFAAALPLASRWYPSRYQGLAMGIAGAGNSGTVLATFFGPRLAQVWGWHAVFGLAIVPLLATLAFFVLFARAAASAAASSPSLSWVGSVARRHWPMRAGDGGVSSSDKAAWRWIVLEYRLRTSSSPKPHRLAALRSTGQGRSRSGLTPRTDGDLEVINA